MKYKVGDKVSLRKGLTDIELDSLYLQRKYYDRYCLCDDFRITKIRTNYFFPSIRCDFFYEIVSDESEYTNSTVYITENYISTKRLNKLKRILG